MTGIMNELKKTLRLAVRSLRDVFCNPGLRRVELAWFGSIIGDWAYATAFSVYAYEKGGPTAVGVVVVLRYLLRALVTPFTSMLGDRYHRRLVMITSDLSAAGLILIAAFLIFVNANPYIIYIIAIVTALCVSPFRPAQASYLPQLANSPEELAASNVTSSTIESIGFFAGPAIAGILLTFSSISIVYIFDAATFAWSAFLLFGIHHSKVETADNKTMANTVASGKTLSEMFIGFRVIFGNRYLYLIAALFFAQTIVAGASAVFEVTIALGLLNLNRSGLGYLNAMLGIGGFIGGFLALMLLQRGRLARDFGIGVFLWSAPLLLTAAWPTVSVTAIMMVLLGLGNSIVDINAYTIIQRITPREIMSRVFGAIESLLIGGMAIGALLMPLLIHTIGIRWGLVLIGAGIASMVSLSMAGLKRVDTIALVPRGLELLRSVSILSVLPDPILEHLARMLVRIEAKKGEVIIQEGDKGDRFYIIESGSVEVTKKGRHIADLSVGDFFGEIALLRNIPRVASITAKSDLVLQALDREQFLPAVTNHGEFGKAADLAITGRLAML